MINVKAPIPYNNFYNKSNELNPLIADAKVRIEAKNVTWSVGEQVISQRMEIPKRIAEGVAVGFPWHVGSKGRLTVGANYGTYKIQHVESLGAVPQDYSSNSITGIRRSSFQTDKGLLMSVINANDKCEIWQLKTPYGEITKRLELVCGYAQAFCFTHDPATDDIWVAEYGEVTATDNPRRVFHSPDGGENWTEHAVDAAGVFRHLHTPIYHPPTGNLYVSTGDDGGKHVYKSTDRGINWTQIPSAVGRKLVSAVVRNDGIIVWGNDEAPTGIYLHDTTTDVFTSLKMHTDGYRGYQGNLAWSNPNVTQDGILMIPTRETPYNPPGIFATKDYVNFHRIFDTSQEGEYDSHGIESIMGPDDKGNFYSLIFGFGPLTSIVFKAPNVYDANEVATATTSGVAPVDIKSKMSVVDCLVPNWNTMPAVTTELMRLAHGGGYVSVSLEPNGKVTLSDGTNTASTGIEGEIRDLLIKWDGKYDKGVQFPFILEITATQAKVKVLNRITHQWAVATINTNITQGNANLTVKGDAKHQVKTFATVFTDEWRALKHTAMAIY